MAWNHSITEEEFFHWLNLDALVILLLILSGISLLILPISDLVGLISRQVGLLAKFGLWSFSVTKASLLAVVSTLSLMPSFVVIFLHFNPFIQLSWTSTHLQNMCTCKVTKFHLWMSHGEKQSGIVITFGEPLNDTVQMQITQPISPRETFVLLLGARQ